MIERLALAALHWLDPETAHDIALRALALGLGPGRGPVAGARLHTVLLGRKLPNPFGLAAGFDKNAVAMAACFRAGFGHVEVGAVTPRPQPGNPRPRLFRLPEDRAVINRFGFNNAGLAAMQARLRGRPAGGFLGVNIGANKDSTDRVADYVALVQGLDGLADYVSINVSSPNTPGLRGLQDAAALGELLAACRRVARVPLVLKIAPDLSDEALADIGGLAEAHGIAAIAATNTTVARDGLRSAAAGQAGGLSGRPLFVRATAVLRDLRRATGGRVTLIGIGGVESAATAYAKIRAGAAAVQLYSALVYAGFGLVPRMAADLDAMLAADGFASVADAVGAET